MPRFRSFLGAWLLAGAFALTAGATGASASTFFVNGTTGADTNACTSSGAACKTIKAAVEKSEVVPGTATIEVAAGVYQEQVNLDKAADNGIAINGSGPSTQIEAPITAENATIAVVGPAVNVTISNLSVVTPSGDGEDGVAVGGGVTLDNVSVDMQNHGNAAGISLTSPIGMLTMNGGSVTMESGTTGIGIFSELGPAALNGVTVTVANGASGSGVESVFGSVSLTNSTVNLGNTATGVGVVTEFGQDSLDNVAVKVTSTNGHGILAVSSSNAVSANNVTVAMENPSNTNEAVAQELGDATFEHLRVGGTWKGESFVDDGANVTIADSRLINGPESTAPAAVFIDSGEGRGALIQRSVLQTTPTAMANLFAAGSNATVDSSELLGGMGGVMFEHGEGKIRTLTLAGTTIDAGILGERDSGEVFDVNATTEGKASVANVNLEGSILLERQKATAEPGDSTTVNCAYSDAPNQTQAATGTEGTIACANGVAGNTTTEPLTALFSAPITSYGPLPGSSAIDSVPASAIALPFGIAPSATDLAGNPRVVDGNGDCVAVQDKGALELQGLAKACPPPPPPPPPPALAAITNLSIAPNALYAAPSGATISKAHKKRKYGATIGWRDSLAATTTFTVIRETGGRKQGKSCKKPSKRNRRGKRCTILTAIGSFTHADVAGANKVHFSGRLNGKKLAKGKYVLQAVPHTAAGNGKAVKRQFKIKG